MRTIGLKVEQPVKAQTPKETPKKETTVNKSK